MFRLQIWPYLTSNARRATRYSAASPRVSSPLWKVQYAKAVRCPTLLRNTLGGMNTMAVVDSAPQTPSLALLLGALIGLPTALWLYKCAMMVVFQRKIIYMGYVPTGTRSESLDPKHPLLKNLHCEEVDIQSDECISLKALVVSKATPQSPTDVIVLYLQGNAGNPLHRIPVFKALVETCKADVSLLAVAPRSYWKSSSSTPTEAGLTRDYLSGLIYATKRWPGTPIVVMGHSLGASIAICLLNNILLGNNENLGRIGDRITGLIVENPFTSVPDMVRILYESRWLPYYYLGHFVWDRWDALHNLQEISPGASASSTGPRTVLEKLARSMLVLTSESDEIVPPAMGRELYNKALGVSDDSTASTSKDPDSKTSSMLPSAKLVVVRGALHDNGWTKQAWRDAVAGYIDSRCRKSRSRSKG